MSVILKIVQKRASYSIINCLIHSHWQRRQCFPLVHCLAKLDSCSVNWTFPQPHSFPSVEASEACHQGDQAWVVVSLVANVVHCLHVVQCHLSLILSWSTLHQNPSNTQWVVIVTPFNCSVIHTSNQTIKHFLFLVVIQSFNSHIAHFYSSLTFFVFSLVPSYSVFSAWKIWMLSSEIWVGSMTSKRME